MEVDDSSVEAAPKDESGDSEDDPAALFEQLHPAMFQHFRNRLSQYSLARLNNMPGEEGEGRREVSSREPVAQLQQGSRHTSLDTSSCSSDSDGFVRPGLVTPTGDLSGSKLRSAAPP